jgi:hypothetical protein
MGFNDWIKNLYGAIPQTQAQTGQTTEAIAASTAQLNQYNAWYSGLTNTSASLNATQLGQWQTTNWNTYGTLFPAQEAKPLELPDEFDTWVEEVRKQNRIEELLKVLVAKCIPEE